MAISMRSIMYTGISVMIVAVMIPMALANIITGGYTLESANMDSSIVTMFTVLLPIIIVIGIVMLYIPSNKKRGN